MSIDLDQLDDLIADYDDDFGSEDLNFLALTALRFRKDLTRQEEQERHSFTIQVRKIRERYNSHRNYLHSLLIYELRRRSPNPERFVGSWHLRRALKANPNPFDLMIMDLDIYKLRIPGISALPEDCTVIKHSLWSIVSALPAVDDTSVICLTRVAPVDAAPKHEFAAPAPAVAASTASFAAPKRLPTTLREGPSPPGIFERLLQFDAPSEREAAVVGLEYAMVNGLQRTLETSILPAPSVFQFCAVVYVSAAASKLPALAGPAVSPCPTSVPAALSEIPLAAGASLRHLVIASDRICITAAHPAVAGSAPPVTIAHFPVSGVKKLRLEAPPPSFVEAAAAAKAHRAFGIDATVVIEGEGFEVRFVVVPPNSGRLVANEVRRVAALAKEAIDASTAVEEVLLTRPLFDLQGLDAGKGLDVDDVGAN